MGDFSIYPGFPTRYAAACMSPHNCGPARFEREDTYLIQCSSVYEVFISTVGEFTLIIFVFLNRNNIFNVELIGF